MKKLLLTTAVLTLAITPTLAVAGGQGVARSCGTITMAIPKASLGLPHTGTWYLSGFAPSKAKLIPCVTVRRVAKRYIRTGTHRGYVVKSFAGLIGRNLYKGTVAADVGFQIYRPSK